MIKEFKVKNFRGFNDEFIFKFDSIRNYDFNTNLIKNSIVNKALIYGKNSSGKSNLGFALMDLTTHLFDGQKILYSGSYCNLDSAEKYASFSYSFDFNGKNVIYSYRKDSQRKLHFEEIKENGKIVFQYDFDTNKYINNINGTDTLVLNIENPDKFSMIKYINNNSSLSEDNAIKQLMNFAKNMLWFRSVRSFEYANGIVDPESISEFIIKENLVSSLQKFLKDCGVEHELVVLKTINNRDVLCAQYKNGVDMLESVASTGTMSLILFFYWMNKMDISFLFIDEFEAFYHYDLSKNILNFINSQDKFQSVLTTHNSFLADNSIMRPDCYFIINENKIKSFADSTPKAIRFAHNLEKMMISGEFDG